jgi:alpha-L-fucosidase 2
MILHTLALAVARAEDLAMPVQITEVEYAVVDGQSLKLDVRVASDRPAKSPAVVMVHGGGWSGGAKGDEPEFLDSLCDTGLTVFAISYRLAPAHRWPAQIDDVRTALQWVIAHAHEHGADATRLGIAGYSAGGHLAALAATVDAPKELAAVLLLAAPTDLVLDNFRRGKVSPSMLNLFGKEQFDSEVIETFWRVSPINYVRPGLPPFLLLNGTKDESVPHAQSAHLHQRLSDVGVPSDLISLEGSPHRLREWKQANENWMNRAGEWMMKTLSRA